MQGTGAGMSHHERGNDHSARGIQEAGCMTLYCLERGEDHSARSHVLGKKGIQEADRDNSLKS